MADLRKTPEQRIGVFLLLLFRFIFFSDLLLLFLRLESYFVAQAGLNLPALLPALAPKH